MNTRTRIQSTVLQQHYGDNIQHNKNVNSQDFSNVENKVNLFQPFIV